MGLLKNIKLSGFLGKKAMRSALQEVHDGLQGIHDESFTPKWKMFINPSKEDLGLPNGFTNESTNETVDIARKNLERLFSNEFAEDKKGFIFTGDYSPTFVSLRPGFYDARISGINLEREKFAKDGTGMVNAINARYSNVDIAFLANAQKAKQYRWSDNDLIERLGTLKERERINLTELGFRFPMTEAEYHAHLGTLTEANEIKKHDFNAATVFANIQFEKMKIIVNCQEENQRKSLIGILDDYKDLQIIDACFNDASLRFKYADAMLTSVSAERIFGDGKNNEVKEEFFKEMKEDELKTVYKIIAQVKDGGTRPMKNIEERLLENIINGGGIDVLTGKKDFKRYQCIQVAVRIAKGEKIRPDYQKLAMELGRQPYLLLEDETKTTNAEVDIFANKQLPIDTDIVLGKIEQQFLASRLALHEASVEDPEIIAGRYFKNGNQEDLAKLRTISKDIPGLGAIVDKAENEWAQRERKKTTLANDVTLDVVETLYKSNFGDKSFN